MECKTCKSLRKEISLTPGTVIFDGTFWQVEHAYPVRIKGWLVIILKRHVEALHEVTREEFEELGTIQKNVSKALNQLLNSQKEYSMCFAEKEGFNHIHFHIVAIPHDLPKKQRGGAIFSLLGVAKDQAIPEKDIADFSEQIKKELQTL